MGRLRRRPGARAALAAALATVLALLMLGALAPISRAETNNAAVANYGGCLKAQKEGDLLLLFDESGSLKDSDPTKARVQAATYLIDQLGEFAGRTKVDLSVSVAGFSDDYHPVLGWTKLDATGTAAMTTAIGTFANRNEGVQTDYWNGLNGARSELSKRRTQADPDRCQAVVWFSDGHFNVYLNKDEYAANKAAQTKVYAPGLDMGKADDAARARDLALKNLCQPKGLADQLRVGGVTLFAIGLTSKDETTKDFDQMRNIATGDNSCGSVHDPVPGDFTLASDIDSLLRAFDRIRDNPPVETTTNVCQSDDPEKCREQGHSFVLDESITRVHILATSSVAGVQAYLIPPGGKPKELSKPGGPLQPESSRYSWATDRSVIVDLVNSTGAAKGWRGQWTLVFVVKKDAQGGQSTASISISGNLQPAWPKHATTLLHTGDTVSGVQFGLVDDAGKEVDSSKLLGTGTFDAELIPAGGGSKVVTSKLDAVRVSGEPQKLELAGVPVGHATLKLTLALTTARFSPTIPGTPLTPAIVNIPVEILPPLGTPRLAPLLDFGSIEGAADATATLDVTGPGCVWMPAGATADLQALPDDLGQVAITSTSGAPNKCLQVAEGQHATMSFHLTTAQGGNGTLAGKLPITISPPGALDKTTVVQVPFTADLHTPIKALNFALALIAALILGPGIPLLLLALLKRLTAKIPGRSLVAQEIPVRVEGGQVLRDGMPLDLRPTDFTQMVPLRPGGSRSTQVSGLTLRARTGLSPFGAGFVEVEAPGRRGLSSEHPRPFGPRESARLPLAVHNTWVATRGPGDPPGAATLLVLSGIDPTGAGRQRLFDDIRSRLPGLMGELGDVDPSRAGAGPADPFGGSGPGLAQPYVDPFAAPASGGWTDPFAAPTSGAPAPTAYGPPPTQSRPAPPPPPAYAPESTAPPPAGPPAPNAPTPASTPPASPAADQPAPPAPPAPPDQTWSFDSAFDDDSGRN